MGFDKYNPVQMLKICQVKVEIARKCLKTMVLFMLQFFGCNEKLVSK